MECVRQYSRPPDGFGRKVTMLWQRTLLQSPCGVRGEPECHHKNPRCLRRGVVSTLKKGNVEIAKCAVDVMPQLQFSTKTRTAKKGTTLKVFLPDAATSSSSSNSKVVKNMCNTCYADSRGNHYLKLKCQNKGTATITFQVYPKNTNKKVYVSKKIFRFKITVK